MNADEILLFIYCDGSLLMIGLKKKKMLQRFGVEQKY